MIQLAQAQVALALVVASPSLVKELLKVWWTTIQQEMPPTMMEALKSLKFQTKVSNFTTSFVIILFILKLGSSLVILYPPVGLFFVIFSLELGLSMVFLTNITKSPRSRWPYPNLSAYYFHMGK